MGSLNEEILLIQCQLESQAYGIGAMCMFDKFYLTFSFKSKVSRDVFEKKTKCGSPCTFDSKMSPQLRVTIYIYIYNQ